MSTTSESTLTSTEPQKRKPQGYIKLAKFMAEGEHVLVKQFSVLAARDLLYLQAELCNLEYEFEAQAAIDANEQRPRELYDREWSHLARSAKEGEGAKQWQFALQIRAKLREYYSAVQQYRAIASIPRPSGQQRQLAHDYTYSEALGGDLDFLGRDLSDRDPYPSVYAGPGASDLLFLGSGGAEEDDCLSRMLIGPGLKAFHKIWRRVKKPALRDEENPAEQETYTQRYEYSSSYIRTTVTVIGSVAASLVPMTAVLTLYFVQRTLTRLILICLFNLAFCVLMCLVTKAKRVEIFAAAAAFSSVLVVFVGSVESGS